ncbi:MAG TPA: hypothetical protein VMA98_10635 [Candidatus Acidoferrales bacterium]|nr:hypothetical protein [Candidatus Acidoferrales bacterium]
MIRRLWCALLLFCAACGGGGGSSPSVAAATPTPTIGAFIVFNSATITPAGSSTSGYISDGVLLANLTVPALAGGSGSLTFGISASNPNSVPFADSANAWAFVTVTTGASAPTLSAPVSITYTSGTITAGTQFYLAYLPPAGTSWQEPVALGGPATAAGDSVSFTLGTAAFAASSTYTYVLYSTTATAPPTLPPPSP